jgi:hypothetical protein
MVDMLAWVAYFGLLLTMCLSAIVRADNPRSLQIYEDKYPRVFFFRQSEGMAANQRLSYEHWEKTFDRLMGIEGKVLEEEVPGRSIRNIEFFTRFKKRHPDQLVLLHFNGNARDPRFDSGRFFAGHWVYYNGARILSDVAAEEGESEIRVSDSTLFRTKMGRYRNANEDIGLCLLDENGRPNWHISEQVQLVSIDHSRNIIRVRRGCYGTTPRIFPADRAYAAAHATEGPWGRKSHLLWFYNYSTKCPKDKSGRMAADILVDNLAALFESDGPLHAFDGLEFDVLHNRCAGGVKRGPDCDADGRADGGYFDGVNTYGTGVIEFCRKLRQRLGDDVIILADGHSVNNQRAFGILNGIESEGWPALRDRQIDDWSGGLNRHFFWHQNARPPVFNYINHKFTMPSGQPGVNRQPDVPFAIHRLVFAAGVFTNSAICYSLAPANDADGLLGIWDEFRMGRANKLGWLGKPLGPAVRLAKQQPDLLAGTGRDIGPHLLKMLEGPDVEFAYEHGAVKITAKDQHVPQMALRLKDVPCKGPDLFVSVTARAAPRGGYPEEMARLMWVGIAPSQYQLIRADLPQTGVRLRAKKETGLNSDTGAVVRFQPNVVIKTERHDCYFVHPPYKGGSAGYTFWQREVRIPPRAELDFYLGMRQKSPARSDGVVFVVEISGVRNDKAERPCEIFRHTHKAHRWTNHTVPLDRWAGKNVRLRFISDCGQANNTTADHSYWADVYVLSPEDKKGPTKPMKFMTWCNEKDFTSGFYFADVRSKRVDLDFVIEGSEPFWISQLTIHAHPDVVYREFENGLVLANPSPRYHTFDMENLFAGRRFRRIRATSRQDTTHNSGKIVSNKVVVGPKDALFLVKER